jgi:hypothetical protein
VVGDVIEIRVPTALTVGNIEVHLRTNTVTSTARVLVDSITLDGSANATGTIQAMGVGFFYARSVLSNMNLSGISGPAISPHTLRGGLVTGAALRCYAPTIFSQTGCLNVSVNARFGGQVSPQVDCYFQNSSLNVNNGGVVVSNGVAFFDVTTASSALIIGVNGTWQQATTADWGTNNAGYAITIASSGRYLYGTKPTINSGLGAGRETRIGGTDKLYAAVPYIEGANNAALVLVA